MKPTTLVWVFGTSLVLGAAGVWRYYNPPHPPANVVVLIDRSDSMLHDCASVMALGLRTLKLPNVSSRSTLSLFSTSDREPLFVNTFHLPAARITTESRKKQLEAEKAFLSELRKSCESMPASTTSPILRSMQMVLSHVKASSPAPNATHYVLARTDLRETSDLWLRNLLQRPGDGGIPSDSARRINNAGVHVIACGYAESLPSRGARSEPPVDRLKELWPQLFTDPKLVLLEPYCPKFQVRPETER